MATVAEDHLGFVDGEAKKANSGNTQAIMQTSMYATGLDRQRLAFAIPHNYKVVMFVYHL